MSVLDFIGQHPDLVGVVITTIGGLILHRNHAIKADDLWDTMMQLGRQVFPVLIRDARIYDDAYVLGKIQDYIWAGLSRLGIKKTPTLEKLVTEVAEHVKAELAQKLFDAHIGDFITTQQKTADVIKAMPPEPKATPEAPAAPVTA
jgi:hypothetical protein